ncbi:RNA exonuclease 3 [Neolecta irregularis DAH-3]|uniref:RNA exonuclease 3 n=1 Tax=Neolecta irregularis (strain DAH-3) TaxID=1198029 RepID=A0A1U7LVT8_NEOID|nr:RNA exonuclease 3 [Neolecta irregularis DAH-3]|eukprot:OLL26662.1 RNA exonuclease 3 [Neolecta irregularis DAH-3]
MNQSPKCPHGKNPQCKEPKCANNRRLAQIMRNLAALADPVGCTQVVDVEDPPIELEATIPSTQRSKIFTAEQEARVRDLLNGNLEKEVHVETQHPSKKQRTLEGAHGKFTDEEKELLHKETIKEAPILKNDSNVCNSKIVMSCNDNGNDNCLIPTNSLQSVQTGTHPVASTRVLSVPVIPVDASTKLIRPVRSKSVLAPITQEAKTAAERFAALGPRVKANPAVSPFAPEALAPVQVKICPISESTRNQMLRLFHNEYLRIYTNHPDRDNQARKDAIINEEKLLKSENLKYTYKPQSRSSLLALKKRAIMETFANESAAPAVVEAEKYVHPVPELEKWGFPIDLPEPEVNAPKDEVGERRECDRCSQRYTVTDNPVENECCFHWGRLTTTTGGRQYTCCALPAAESTGCCQGVHVFKISSHSRLASQIPFIKSPTDEGGLPAIALDCEMVYTTSGMELSRVTIVDWDGEKLVDIFVRPENTILDYNTRFSGITSLKDVPAVSFSEARGQLFKFTDSRTIFIGHGLENDLLSLRLVHHRIIDTSILYPSPRGRPYRLKLRDLAAQHLNKKIQDAGAKGHDSFEDAKSALELVWKRITG